MNEILFRANGKERTAAPGATVADVLSSLDLRPSAVVVERNGEPLDRARFSQTPVCAGDRLEIAQMVGGG